MPRVMPNGVNAPYKKPYSGKNPVSNLITDIANVMGLQQFTQKVVLEKALQFITENQNRENPREVEQQLQQSMNNQKLAAASAQIRDLEKKLAAAVLLISQLRKTSSPSSSPVNSPVMRSGTNPSMMCPPQLYQQNHNIQQQRHVFPQQPMMNSMSHQSQNGQLSHHNDFTPMMHSSVGYPPQFAQIQRMMRPQQMAAHPHHLPQQNSMNQMFPGVEQMTFTFAHQTPQQQPVQESLQLQYFDSRLQQIPATQLQSQPAHQPNQANEEAHQPMDFQPTEQAAQPDPAQESSEAENQQVMSSAKIKIERENREKQANSQPETQFNLAKVKVERRTPEPEPQAQPQQAVPALAKVKTERQSEETQTKPLEQTDLRLAKIKVERDIQPEQQQNDVIPQVQPTTENQPTNTQFIFRGVKREFEDDY